DQDAFELGADSLFGESALYCGDSRSQGCVCLELFFCQGDWRTGDSSAQNLVPDVRLGESPGGRILGGERRGVLGATEPPQCSGAVVQIDEAGFGGNG